MLSNINLQSIVVYLLYSKPKINSNYLPDLWKTKNLNGFTSHMDMALHIHMDMIRNCDAISCLGRLIFCSHQNPYFYFIVYTHHHHQSIASMFVIFTRLLRTMCIIIIINYTVYEWPVVWWTFECADTVQKYGAISKYMYVQNIGCSCFLYQSNWSKNPFKFCQVRKSNIAPIAKWVEKFS